MSDTLVKELHDALAALLKRDFRSTCMHEETHREGIIWEVCDHCRQQWADDRGGKPEWKDPDEWSAAQDALDKAKAVLDKDSSPFPRVSGLEQEERYCIEGLLYDEVEKYAKLLRENSLATPITCAIDEEMKRLKLLANKISRQEV